jgi:hypothetical protein
MLMPKLAEFSPQGCSDHALSKIMGRGQSETEAVSVAFE